MAKKKKGEDDTSAVTEEVVEKGGGRKIILLAAIFVGVALLGAGAMAGGLIGGNEREAAATEPTEAPSPEDLGMLVELESLTINLADGRFLKIGVAIELGPDVSEEPPTAPIYDAMIAEFNRHTMGQLADPAVRAGTKANLLTSLSGTYGDQIAGVYYTEFVMQ